VEEYDGPKELRMVESQRKSERATLNGALAQVMRDFVKERLMASCCVMAVIHVPSRFGALPGSAVCPEIIGCVSVERKPTLAYKCWTANKNATSINLCTGDDWDGLVDDVLAKTKTKKDISVNIIVLPEIREFVIATCGNLGGLRGMWSGVFK
jgi:hypothetical protein